MHKPPQPQQAHFFAPAPSPFHVWAKIEGVEGGTQAFTDSEQGCIENHLCRNLPIIQPAPC